MENKILFNFSKLRGLIKEKVNRQDILARKIGISPASLSSKLNGQTEFTLSEITRIIKVLDIPKNEISTYFFNLVV